MMYLRSCVLILVLFCNSLIGGNLNLSLPHTTTNLILEEESRLISQATTAQAKANTYFDRAESFLLLGKVEQALSDFQEGCFFCSSIPESEVRSKIELRSLFGMMLCYAVLNEEETAVSIAIHLKDLLANYSCDCDKVILCKDEEFVIGPDKEPYSGWCAETVSATCAALCGLVRASRLATGAKESLMFTLIKLKDEGLKCCAKGGLWKGCVGPLAKKLHQWKAFGIPADPSWD